MGRKRSHKQEGFITRIKQLSDWPCVKFFYNLKLVSDEIPAESQQLF
jgi:hypothetical protein